MNDRDNIFENVIEIGLRMYGNGCSYPKNVVNYITEYCRQQIRYYFIQHKKLINNNNRILYLHTLVYKSRHKKDCLKRLQQFLHAKDRSSSQQEQFLDQIIKDNKKLTITNRFNRICYQLKLNLNNNNEIISKLDDKRSRQYIRLDQYYKNDKLSSNDYLQFIEQQHTSFNNLRSLSLIDINHWIKSNNLILSNQDLRLADICVFLIKEILLNLMDKVYYSSIPCQIDDILRRQYVSNHRRLLYSKRKRINN